MDVQELHEKEVKKGAKLAKADYIEAHPEIGDIDSDFDSLEEFTARKLNLNVRLIWYNSQTVLVSLSLKQVIFLIIDTKYFENKQTCHFHHNNGK